jgi:hypothetical protein
MSERKFYLHFINMAPSAKGVLVDLTVELEPDRKVVIGRYTVSKTVQVAISPQPEGIVNPPDPPQGKQEVKKIGFDIASVSRNHGTFSRTGDDVYYQDHSTYGTEYSQGASGKSATRLSNQRTKIVPGDVLYFGEHTDEIPFKYCVRLTRRAKYREK